MTICYEKWVLHFGRHCSEVLDRSHPLRSHDLSKWESMIVRDKQRTQQCVSSALAGGVQKRITNECEYCTSATTLFLTAQAADTVRRKILEFWSLNTLRETATLLSFNTTHNLICKRVRVCMNLYASVKTHTTALFSRVPLLRRSGWFVHNNSIQYCAVRRRSRNHHHLCANCFAQTHTRTPHTHASTAKRHTTISTRVFCLPKKALLRANIVFCVTYNRCVCVCVHPHLRVPLVVQQYIARILFKHTHTATTLSFIRL